MKINTEQIYSVGIVGLGAIGLGYDFGQKEDFILTHTRAFTKHPGFDLRFGVDIDATSRKKFESVTNKNAFQSLKGIDCSDIDVLIVSTHPETRKEIVRQIDGSPKIILFEKPLASSIEDAIELLNLSKVKQSKVVVNFMRRFDPALIKIRDDILMGAFGRPLRANAVYSGSMVGNSSHYIDLLCFFFDRPENWGIIQSSCKVEDLNEEAFDFWLTYQGWKVLFQTVPSKDYSVGEIDIYFEKGVFRYHDWGRHSFIQWAEIDPQYPGYQHLNKEGTSVNTDLEHGIGHTAEHIYRHLNNESPIFSTGETALASLKICSDLKKKWNTRKIK